MDQSSAKQVPIVALNEVGKTFTTPAGPLHILRNVSLTVHAGEKVAIIGPSGSGKSTLLSLVGLLDVPTTGEVFIEGQAVGSMRESALAKLRNEKIGLVFQSFELIAPFTVRENITAPHDIAGTIIADELFTELTTTTGLTGRLDAFPRTLSGGEKQRAAIARALAMQPKLLLADEPTGSLDRATGERVLSLLLETTTKHGTALIIITHDDSIAKRMDRVYQIKDGSLYEQT
ncbi:MAG: ABC transporter ATP-binding protein [Candidatus Pacebacteria bacterium]|nr:ABC transporter ATP-binding protein [Candidatus Paceibacterota bacterium]